MFTGRTLPATNCFLAGRNVSALCESSLLGISIMADLSYLMGRMLCGRLTAVGAKGKNAMLVNSGAYRIIIIKNKHKFILYNYHTKEGMFI